MYELTDKEHERFSSCPWFRFAILNLYASGLTKEEAFSAMILELLRERDENRNAEIKRLMASTSSPIIKVNQ